MGGYKTFWGFIFLVISIPSAKTEPVEGLLKSVDVSNPQNLIETLIDKDEVLTNQVKSFIQQKLDRKGILKQIPSMNVPETIHYWGYPVEEHFITTEDGYILGVHRIPHGKFEKFNIQDAKDTKKPSIFLGHGLGSSSASYAWGPPDKSLGYILADAGYDVWMGNTRGNTYSKNHTTFDTCSTCPDFWNFGWHEAAMFDLSGVIDHILEHTQNDYVYYIGHSQGTTEYLALLSDRPEYNEKINAGFLLAPVGYLTLSTSFEFKLAPYVDALRDLITSFGKFEWFPHRKIYSLLGHLICDEEMHPLTEKFCAFIANNVIGFSEGQLNETMIPVYLDHEPDATSPIPLYHFAQLSLQNFSMVHYDDGTTDLEPPPYDLNNVQTPTAMFIGAGDTTADDADNQVLANDLPNVFHYEVIKGNCDDPEVCTQWTHDDFVCGIDAPILIYNTILEYIDEFESIKL